MPIYLANRRELLLSLAGFAVSAAPDYGSSIARLEKNLTENIIPFWMPRCLDEENGGYRINFDAAGKPTSDNTKMIVTQARMVWLFSRLAREGRESEKMLSAAQHGFEFLRDRMWDHKNGGFYWLVDATGGKPIERNKHLYGESFGLYALAEYAGVSKKPEALALARDLFQLLESNAHDDKYGGYLESFREDWTAFPEGASSYMGPVEFKLMNTHLHLLESMTAYYRASKAPIARERVLELIEIQSNSVVRKGLTGCTDKYQRNWEPVLTGNYARVSYGHDLENIWLLADACKEIGTSTYPLLDLYKKLFEYSFTYGFDKEKGGFFDSGPFRQAADQRIKTWWVQAEALVSSLYMFRLTRDAQYWDVFSKTLDFVDRYQTDWRVGEWHAEVQENGQGTGAKAQAWKAGYHNGRSMLECIQVLRDLRSSA